MIGPMWRYLNGLSLYCQIFHISGWECGNNQHSILDIVEAKIGGGGEVPPRCYHLLLCF
jgi:hypothetical protein